jgi:hypothetical protein
VIVALTIQKEIQMNKFLLVTIALILLVILSACGSRVAIDSDAEKISKAASDIADFSLPAGYSPEFTAQLAGYTAVAYNPGDGHSHLYLIQSEKETDKEELAKTLANLVPGSSDRNTRLTVIEKRDTTVRGQAATIVVSDGVNSEGSGYRQITVAFQGKGGPALLVLSQPTESWDDSSVDTLLASIQ